MSNLKFNHLLLFLVLLGFFLSETAIATEYVCEGWEYHDGSRDKSVIKLEIDGDVPTIDGTQYQIVGKSLDLNENVDALFLAIDRRKQEGRQPIWAYLYILEPCVARYEGAFGRFEEDYEKISKEEFETCSTHILVRILKPASRIVNGMQRTKCIIF